MATPMGLLHKQLGRVIMPKTTTLYDPKPERKGHSPIRAQYCSFIIISILIHLLTPSPHVSLPYGTNVEIEHFGVVDFAGDDSSTPSILFLTRSSIGVPLEALPVVRFLDLLVSRIFWDPDDLVGAFSWIHGGEETIN